jgi:hypothetical protein
MNTQISSKLGALAVAVVINMMIIGGVAHLFTAELQTSGTVLSQDGSTTLSSRDAA